MSGIPRPKAPVSTSEGARVGSGETWTTRRLLKWIEEHLTAKGVDAPRVCAQMLVSHVLQCDRMRLYMEADRPASPDELATLRALVARAAKHEPVQYVVGEAWFWSKRFKVNPSTLIPRACTEHLVEHVVSEVRRLSTQQSASGSPRQVRVLEIGTGTGCVVICAAAALQGQRKGAEASETPSAPAVDVSFVATDIVPEALLLAQENAAAHGVQDRIQFMAGSLYGALQGRGWERTFDIVVSNPPYVADSEWKDLAANVRDYEPASALAGGAQGMDVVRPLIDGAHAWMAPGGLLAMEFGHHQHDIVLAAARANKHLGEVRTHKDFEDFWRTLTARVA
jgi:release factor glutamine methyltransferase